MAHRIEISYKIDSRIKSRTARIRSLGFNVDNVLLVEVYTISRNFSRPELEQVAEQLTNPVTQKYSIDSPTLAEFDFAVEVGFLPGVTDNTGNAAKQTIEDFFKIKFRDNEAVHSSQLFLFAGKLTEDEIQGLGTMLANPLIQRIHTKT